MFELLMINHAEYRREQLLCEIDTKGLILTLTTYNNLKRDVQKKGQP